MAASAKRVRSSAKDDLKQQEITQAVVIADNFNEKFCPLTIDKPAVLLPVVNETLLDYVLHSLEECGIQETFIFCCAHNQQIRSYVSSSQWTEPDTSMSVIVISSSSFMSMGDIIRELDSKALIRSDFILIRGDVITTCALNNLLEEHKKRRLDDKSCALTLVYKKALPNHKTRCKEDDFFVAVNSNTQRVRYYQKLNKKKRNLHIPLEVFQENDEIELHYDLLDIHICICSPCVPPLFSDNFDYQSLEDFIKGLIVNEELLGNSMYIHIAKSGYGASISNLYMYDAISQDILNRWTYPVVPDLIDFSHFKYVHARHNIYTELGVTIGRNCILKQNVAIGKGTKLGENTYITNSVIGRNCIIGNNVEIKGAYLWSDVTIGDNCKLDTCLLADKVILHDNVNVNRGCIIGSEVVIGHGIKLPEFTKLQAHASPEEDSFGEDILMKENPPETEVCDIKLVGENGHGFLCTASKDSDEEEDDTVEDLWGVLSNESFDEDETVDTSSSAILSPGDELLEESDGVADDYDDDIALFYNEVFESLQRGMEEKVKCENMILEINSSKHAYNISMKEVNTLLVKAILKMPLEAQEHHNLTAQQYFLAVKKNLHFFHPLISNYIRSIESQLDCLSSVEEFMKANENLSPAVMKVLHFWYDRDVLHESVICKWFENIPLENEKIRKQASAFIKWLQEADEESSESSE